MLRAAGIEPPLPSYLPSTPDADKLATRGEFADSLASTSPAFVSREAERCLRCDSACLRCVEVCPNRANFAMPISAGSDGVFTQSIQILHLDAFCNECGNCGLFCPYEGEPYRGKPTLFKDVAALEASGNAGFAFGDGANPGLILREAAGGTVATIAHANWAAKDAAGAGSARTAAVARMASLARAVFHDHAYLLGGER